MVMAGVLALLVQVASPAAACGTGTEVWPTKKWQVADTGRARAQCRFGDGARGADPRHAWSDQSPRRAPWADCRRGIFPWRRSWSARAGGVGHQDCHFLPGGYRARAWVHRFARPAADPAGAPGGAARGPSRREDHHPPAPHHDQRTQRRLVPGQAADASAHVAAGDHLPLQQRGRAVPRFARSGNPARRACSSSPRPRCGSRSTSTSTSRAGRSSSSTAVATVPPASCSPLASSASWACWRSAAGAGRDNSWFPLPTCARR